jgi:hypothetical protein
MPLQPVIGGDAMPLETEADALAVLREGIQRASRSYDHCWLGDHLFYLGAVKPELRQVLQGAIVALDQDSLAVAHESFDSTYYIMRGASNSCVEALRAKLPQAKYPLLILEIIAAIDTPVAMEVLAQEARAYSLIKEIERLGFAIPRDGGPAIRRFSPHRLAVLKYPVSQREELRKVACPSGLPIEEVVSRDPANFATWHYCSFATEKIRDIVSIQQQKIHLLGPDGDREWEMFCKYDGEGKYEVLPYSHLQDGDNDTDWLAETRPAWDNDPRSWSRLELEPYDDNLVYTNGHILLTKHAVGTVGGPRIALYTNPICPNCKLLMFHVAWVDYQVREHSCGFIELYYCENCEIVGSQAIGHN